MTNQHPITPPDELVQKWLAQYFGCQVSGELSDLERYLATQSACWGYEQGRAISEAELQKARDEELEACCAIIHTVHGLRTSDWLRSMRRPKPKSLAEQKQAIHDEIHQLLAQISASNAGALAVAEPIRRALERLRELEAQ